MDPAEWEILADRIAGDLAAEVTALEDAFWPEAPQGSFRDFWRRVRDLNERVRVAPAIKLDDKLALQRRLNELCQRARHDQKELRGQAARLKDDLMDGITLARESAEEASTVDEAQQVRADLAAIRERLSHLEASMSRADRQEIWEQWQRSNQLAWDRLNAAWGANEQALTGILDRAEECLAARDARGAKEQIKAFHAEAPVRECSHRALKNLRSRAGDVWRRADELGQKKHADYLAFASRRLGQWKAMREQHARARGRIEVEIDELERRAAGAATDVAAALLRGQAVERRRELARLESEDRALEEQIDRAEVAIGSS